MYAKTLTKTAVKDKKPTINIKLYIFLTQIAYTGTKKYTFVNHLELRSCRLTLNI